MFYIVTILKGCPFLSSIKPTISSEEKLDEGPATGDADDEADDDEDDSPDASPDTRRENGQKTAQPAPPHFSMMD